MAFNDFSELPEGVKNFIFGPEISQYNGEISDQFGLNRNQMYFILNLEEGLFLKKWSVLNLPNRLEEMERAEYYDLRAIALDLAYKILWPLQDFLGEVDRLILRLGAKVPRPQHLTSAESGSLPPVLGLPIREALDKYAGLKDLRLTNNKIVNKEGHLVSPTIDNWIKDYVHFLGAGQHGSLERAKYLSQNPNALSLQGEDLESLRYLFISYDDNLPVHIDTAGRVVRIREIKPKTAAVQTIKSPEEFLEGLKRQLEILDKSLLSAEILLSEAGGQVIKLRDMLWQAVGFGDKDKAISCLKVLIDRRGLDQMLREDNRFKNILKRFVGIRYGYLVEQGWEQIPDAALRRRIFLEMILEDKLALGPQVTAVAFYLTNIVPGDTPLVYFDESEARLRWRALQVNKNQLVWSDEVA